MTRDPLHTARLALSAQARHLWPDEARLLDTLDRLPAGVPATREQRRRLAEACRRMLGDERLAEAVERETAHAA
jgi:hypothetical protein